MPINSSIQNLQSQSLLLNAQYSSVRQTRSAEITAVNGEGGRSFQAQATYEASYAALGVRVFEEDGSRTTVVDSVQIDLSINLSIESANQILNDRIAEKLNAAFEEAGVDLDIREIQNQNLDTSPEATAKRIVSFATGFFGAFVQNQGEVQGEVQGEDQYETARLEDFMSLIGVAIDEGFAEALDILKGIADISGKIQDNVDRTYELVQKGLEEFRQRQLDLFSKRTAEPSATPALAQPAPESFEGIVI